jgi:hypothetical protein
MAALLTVCAAVAVVVSACGVSARPGLTAGAWTPPASNSRRLSFQGSAHRGAPVRQSEVEGRVLVNARRGYALATIGSATYPVRTTNGGRTWVVAGPELHQTAAQGAVGVRAVGGSGNARTAFAWGGVNPNSVVDITTDGGKHWWQAFLPGAVLYVASVDGEVVANVAGSVRSGNATHTGLWAYRTRTGRRWVYGYNVG